MATKQYNLKLPLNLAQRAEDYAQRYGYRNLQDLAIDSLREKLFEKSPYDQTISQEEIIAIDKLLETSIKNHQLVDEKALREKLRS